LQYYKDKKKLHDAYNNSSKEIEAFIDVLTTSLNNIHGSCHGSRYWSIILRSWLRYIVENYNHHTRMDVNNKLKIINNNIYYVPRSFKEFISHVTSVGWNNSFLCLISLLECRSIIKCDFLKKNETKESGAYDHYYIDLIHYFSRLIPAKRLISISFRSPYLYISAFFRLGLIPIPARIGNLATHSPVNLHLRESLYHVGLSEKRIINKPLWKIICATIPINYLEDYKNALNYTMKYHGKPVYAVFTSSIHFDDMYKIWIANCVENNTKLIIGQHGGGYGISYYDDIEKHEISISDLYLSWFKSDNKQVIQVPSNKKIAKKHTSNVMQIVLMNTAVPSFYKYFSGIIEDQILKDIDDQIIFLSEISGNVFRHIVVRQYPHRYHIDIDEIYEAAGFGCLVDNRTDYNHQMSTSDLVVVSYLGTTWLECLMNNIPVIIFCDSSRWEMRAEVTQYLNKLRSVNILHNSPISAANHLNLIFSDIYKWWEDEVLQSVRKEFCQRFAYTERNWEKKWVDAIGSILKE